MHRLDVCLTMLFQRAETDFFSGEPLNALSTLVYSQNIDLQRSASLTFAEITERGSSFKVVHETGGVIDTHRCASGGQAHSRTDPLPLGEFRYRSSASSECCAWQSRCRWSVDSEPSDGTGLTFACSSQQSADCAARRFATPN